MLCVMTKIHAAIMINTHFTERTCAKIIRIWTHALPSSATRTKNAEHLS